MIAMAPAGHPAGLSETQRVRREEQRQYHRVPVSVAPLQAWCWIGSGAPPHENKAAVDPSPFARDLPADASPPRWKAIQGQIVDMSGGGLGFLCSDEVGIGTCFDLRFVLPGDTAELVVRARVVSARPKQTVNGTRYMLGMMFVEPSTGVRERIAKAMHRLQLTDRRRTIGAAEAAKLHAERRSTPTRPGRLPILGRWR